MSGETRRVVLEWTGKLTFRGGEPGGPATIIDAENAEAPGPMLQLLLGAAACSGADVVSILEKMRLPVRSLRIEASGLRQTEHPKRYLSLHLDFHISADALDEARARRAIDLSLTKYCSVIHSLAPDIRITHGLTLG